MSGGTVAATVARGLSVGMLPERAAHLANTAAGSVVGKPGTSQVLPNELAAALRHQELAPVDAKIVLADEAVAQTRLWQSQKLSVGFTNGCFHLLHPGHLSCLVRPELLATGWWSRSTATIQVRRLKGKSRPVQTELARAAVLACLDMVDLVVIFRETTPIALVEAVQHNLLVKGADYRLDDFIGSDLVQSYGGKVYWRS